MNRFNLNLDINLDMVIDKYFSETGVSTICDCKIGQELVEALEELGYIIDENDFVNLCYDIKNPVIITKINNNKDGVIIEKLYEYNEKIKAHECSYLYQQYGLLNEEKSKLIVGHKEKKILIVYNF